MLTLCSGGCVSSNVFKYDTRVNLRKVHIVCRTYVCLTNADCCALCVARVALRLLRFVMFISLGSLFVLRYDQCVAFV